MEENLFLFRRFRLLDQAGKQRVDQQFQEMELTAMQSYVLRYLHDRAGEVVYPKDIEQRFHLTHPTVSGLLARLEAKGFIVCTPDPDDRRCKRVTATEKAEQCHLRHPRHVPHARAGDAAKLQPRGGADATAAARPGNRKSIRR